MFVYISWSFPDAQSTKVLCELKKNCILPFQCEYSDDIVIQWQQLPDNSVVHSFYHNQDQLAHQHPRFRGRTSMFKDQISSGNASLLLTEIQMQDQGTYVCHTTTKSGNKQLQINLQVEGIKSIV